MFAKEHPFMKYVLEIFTINVLKREINKKLNGPFRNEKDTYKAYFKIILPIS